MFIIPVCEIHLGGQAQTGAIKRSISVCGYLSFTNPSTPRHSGQAAQGDILRSCQSEHLTDESREVRGPFDSAQGDKTLEYPLTEMLIIFTYTKFKKNRQTVEKKGI